MSGEGAGKNNGNSRLFQAAARVPLRSMKRALVITANIIILNHLFTQHVGSIQETEGPSMLPTLRARGDWILHDRISHRIFGPRSLVRGSLVVYTSPLDRTRAVCKRLIGLPGDVICVDPFSEVDPEDVNGQNVPNNGGKLPHIVVPEGHFWAQGDNRPLTRDSTTYGPVPFGLLRGQARAIISFWPLSIRRVPTGITEIEP